jgi:copper chaperone CopZ
MISRMKLGLVGIAALAGTSLLCPLCEGGVRVADAQQVGVQAQAPDTAVVRFHIDGMTCGGCAATARVAFKRLPGVFDATVSFDDALGVVRYDPRRATPAQIAAHLNRLTGYRATVIPEGAKAPRLEP